MQVDEIIERILSCDAEGLNDCIDNAGKPYQSEFMAATLKAAKDWLDSPLCTFCRHRVGNDSITDTNGEIACRSCGEAEIAEQRSGQSVATPPPRAAEGGVTMARLLDWVGFQILMYGPHRIVCDPYTKFGTWCIERAGSWVYGRPGAQA